MRQYTLNINGRLLDLSTPKVMAIVNATTDSFAFACTNFSEAEVLVVAAQAVSGGADILDVGACSTRPGFMPVSPEEEWRRLNIALSAIRGAYPEVVVSVDTFRADIARKAVVQFGVNIINDVTGGADSKMFVTAAELGVPYIYTYTASLPDDAIGMVAKMIEETAKKIDTLHRLGVKDVIFDPGFGFNKTEAQNYAILSHLADLRNLDVPVLVGLSRKSMFYKPLNTTPQSETTLAATIAADTLALKAGAQILRVHDVAAAKTTIDIIHRIV